jgi:hypothetical protein
MPPGDEEFEELSGAVTSFVAAVTQPPGARLPSDYVTDPARACANLEIVRAGIATKEGNAAGAAAMGSGSGDVKEGLDGDALVKRVLVPPPASADAAVAAAKLRELFPAAVVGSAGLEAGLLDAVKSEDDAGGRAAGVSRGNGAVATDAVKTEVA